MALLPLDAASDAGALNVGDRLAREYGLDRGAHIASGHRLVVARPAVVELATIDELPCAVE